MTAARNEAPSRLRRDGRLTVGDTVEIPSGEEGHIAMLTADFVAVEVKGKADYKVPQETAEQWWKDSLPLLEGDDE